MDYINEAISELMNLLFRTADRKEIDETVKKVIDLLKKAKKELG